MTRWTITSSLVALLLAGSASGQAGRQVTPPTATTKHRAPAAESDCLTCHTCAQPAAGNPCLRPCARSAATDFAEALARQQGPDIVVLDELEDLFLPVPFDHRGHARMTQMVEGGCTICHHYTPIGAQHPACKTCHETSPQREDFTRPSLKAAYHRQCLSCHREWSHETQCSVCHPPKAGRATVVVPTRDDIMGLMHPPIPEPDTLTYTSAYGADGIGTAILFRHHDHIHRFGLQCVDCHHEDGCAGCHSPATPQVPVIERAPRDHHQPCLRCHATEQPDTCQRCHRAPGEATPRFSHASTGWDLGPYHAALGCRACHATVPFSRPPADCDACHADWSPTTFDHRVTGQFLDDSHASQDCADCHEQRHFDRPPTCDACHDDDITFPHRRPGPYYPTAQPRPGG